MRGRRNRLLVGLAAIAVVFCLFVFHQSTAQAAINPEINFQGKLTNPDGTNVADGTYSIVFSIYSVASGGTAVWTETQSSVSVSAGIFQVQLGSVTPLPGSVNFNSSPLYLGVKVGADPEMTPRIQFTAAPYAFNADQLDGLDATNFVQLAQGIQTDSSATNASLAINKTGSTAQIVNIQRGGSTVFSINNDGSTLFQNQADSTTGFQIQDHGNNPLFTADTQNDNLIVGSATTDATQVLLQLDSYNAYSDSVTCSTTTNQGAMYYNTSTGTMRSCINGNWEDMLSTGGMGLIAFGVIPDSSNSANAGELGGITPSTSPCKTYWASVSTVTVAPCYAYSGGRKVTVPATTLSVSGVTASRYVNICLDGTNGAPVLESTTGSTTDAAATEPTWSTNNPILCIATLQISTTAGRITNGKIYDTRTFTVTQKTFATSNTALGLGWAVIQSGTANQITTTTGSKAGNVAGVVVGYSGATSTTTANVILATAGPQWVKATGTSTAGQDVMTTTTAGYTASTANATTAINYYSLLGIATQTIDTTCTSAATCQYSQFLNPLAIR